MFGCCAHVLIAKEKRAKFDDKSHECIMVGYSSNDYRLWDAKKQQIVNSRDVKFQENVNAIGKDLAQFTAMMMNLVM